MRKTAFIYSEEMARRDSREDDIFGPTRLQYTYELLRMYGAFDRDDSELTAPRDADEGELSYFHTSEYISAVKSLSSGEQKFDPRRFNFGGKTGDNPVYSGMYELSTLVVGATLKAAELVVSGEVDTAFNCAGGLHHAAPDHASGFCIFNDLVITIKDLVEKGFRIAYIDVDAHHGDGVQNAFYETDRVLTISLHQTGRLLFPGTGDVSEIGTGPGRGYAVNIPLAPYTFDDVYLWAFDQVVPSLVQKYHPDIVVTQLGADTHYLDPLTQLSLTTDGYSEIVEKIKALSARWIAVGGGGYEISGVVRLWTLAYGKMLGIDWPDEIPSEFQELYGIKILRDKEEPKINPKFRPLAKEFAEKTVNDIKKLIFPLHGL